MILAGVQRWANWAGGNSRLAADAVAGSPSVQVANARGFAVGQIVMLDEASGASWQPDPLGRGEIWASPDGRVVWQKHKPPLAGDDFDANTYPYAPGSAAAGSPTAAGRPMRCTRLPGGVVMQSAYNSGHLRH
jgi:hypothetical protein